MEYIVDNTFLIAIVFIVTCALPCIVIGCLVAFKQKRILIAGWDDKLVTNPKLVAQIIGHSVTTLGIITAIAAISAAVGYLTFTHAGIAVCFGITLPLLASLYTTIRYSVDRC
jgi:hypothetical protein